MRHHQEIFKSEGYNEHQSHDSGISFSFLDDSKLLASLKLNPLNSDSTHSLFSRSSIDSTGITFGPMVTVHDKIGGAVKHEKETAMLKEKPVTQAAENAAQKPDWHKQLESEAVSKQSEWLKKIAGPDGTISLTDYLKAVKELADTSNKETNGKDQSQKWIASSVIYEALKNSGNKPVTIDTGLPSKPNCG